MVRKIILILILLIPLICAIRINEFESNPAGIDAGNEWVELYNKKEINLTGYKLVNNDGDEIWLKGSFKKYFVYVFEKQWLDNVDEKVFLYNGDELIDETDLFDDSENDKKTWQLCDDWEFIKETKDGKNDCKEEEIIIEEPEPIEEEVVGIPEPELIKLNTQTIKSEDDKKILSKDNAKYGFVFFCVLLLFLFILRKNKYKKNEFN